MDAFGDEPSMLALENPEVPVYVSASRVDAAEVAKERDNPGILILDDAYQHLKIKRDLNLLLVDAERGFGNSQLLPLGPLREPLESAERADAVIVTKSNLGNFDEVFQTVLKFKRDGCPVFRFDYRIEKITSLEGQEEKETSELKGKRLLLSSGIANPQSFSKLLKLEEGCPVAEMRFEDHHNYSSNINKHRQDHRHARTHVKVNRHPSKLLLAISVPLLLEIYESIQEEHETSLGGSYHQVHIDYKALH